MFIERITKKLNLDGPWWCVTCGTRSVYKQNAMICVNCGRKACSCAIDGFAGCDIDPRCEHHGVARRVEQ